MTTDKVPSRILASSRNTGCRHSVSAPPRPPGRLGSRRGPTVERGGVPGLRDPSSRAPVRGPLRPDPLRNARPYAHPATQRDHLRVELHKRAAIPLVPADQHPADRTGEYLRCRHGAGQSYRNRSSRKVPAARRLSDTSEILDDEARERGSVAWESCDGASRSPSMPTYCRHCRRTAPSTCSAPSKVRSTRSPPPKLRGMPWRGKTRCLGRRRRFRPLPHCATPKRTHGSGSRRGPRRRGVNMSRWSRLLVVPPPPLGRFRRGRLLNGLLLIGRRRRGAPSHLVTRHRQPRPFGPRRRRQVSRGR